MRGSLKALEAEDWCERMLEVSLISLDVLLEETLRKRFVTPDFSEDFECVDVLRLTSIPTIKFDVKVAMMCFV